MTPADVAEAAKKAGKPVPTPQLAVSAPAREHEIVPAKKKMPPVQPKAEMNDDLRAQLAALEKSIRHQQNELEQLERRIKEADDHAGR